MNLKRLIPDKIYISLQYYHHFKHFPNLKDPKTYNEKLQWLKLYDRRPEYTVMVDKYLVKQYIAKQIGDQYVIPTLGVWDRAEDIDFDSLPNQFVLKTNHDSGGIVICKDKKTFNREAAIAKLSKHLQNNGFWYGREWPYKNVKPRIFAEEYMTDESGIELKDYKVFNFNGEPKMIQVDYDRFKEHKRNLYDLDWKYIEAAIQYPTEPEHLIDRPKKLEELLEMAKKLSKGIPHVRTDFYCIDDKVYFGEMTFYHGSGLEKFTPDSLNLKMGSWIKLPLGGVPLK